MRRAIISFLSLASLGLVCAVATNCGGSSGSAGGGGCTGGPYNVVGDWAITTSGNGMSTSGPGVINGSGLAVFFQTSTTPPAPGDTVVLPTLTGTCSFSGTATAYGTPASGGGSAVDTVQGKVNSTTSITGKISNGNTFSIVSSSPLTGSVTAFSGTRYIGEIEGWTGTDNIWRLDLEPTGSGASMTIGGSNNQCDINGTFTQEGSVASNLNVFDVSITYTQEAGCPKSGSGVGFESSVDYFNVSEGQPGPYFYAVLSNGASVLEIINSTP